MLDKAEGQMVDRMSERIAYSIHKKCVNDPNEIVSEVVEDPGGARPEAIIDILDKLLEKHRIEVSFNGDKTQLAITITPRGH